MNLSIIKINLVHYLINMETIRYFLSNSNDSTFFTAILLLILQKKFNFKGKLFEMKLHYSQFNYIIFSVLMK